MGWARIYTWVWLGYKRIDTLVRAIGHDVMRSIYTIPYIYGFGWMVGMGDGGGVRGFVGLVPTSMLFAGTYWLLTGIESKQMVQFTASHVHCKLEGLMEE